MSDRPRDDAGDDARAAAERWASVERLLDRALDVPTAERAGFVARETAHDDALRAEIEALLAHCGDAGEVRAFLAAPAAEFAAPLLAASFAASLAGREPGVARRRPPPPTRIGPYRVLD